MSTLLIEYPEIRRGRRLVLAGGSVRATLPRTIGIVGENGSGKTSLFLCLAGALDRARGTIRIDGRPARVTFAPQVPSLPPWLTVRQTAALYGHDLDRLDSLMAPLRLGELAAARTSALSTGQQQVVGVALALASAADVTLLDEPFSALDFRRRSALLELLGERCAGDAGAHCALLISSQAAPDLAQLCNRYVVLRDGRCVFDGEIESRDQRRVEERLLELLD